MYILEILIATHRDIAEQDHFLEMLVHWSGHPSKFYDGIIKASNFFEHEVCDHMKLEDDILYPVLKRCLPREKAGLVSQMEIEHIEIKKRIKEFSEGVHGLKQSSKPEDRVTIINLSKAVLQVLVPHSRNEYELVPGLIKEHFKSEDYREVEGRYFRSIHR